MEENKMSDYKNEIAKRIQKILPGIEKLDFAGCVSDTGYSLEFYATLKGQKYQCYELSDDGALDENDLDEFLRQLSKYLRTVTDYNKGELNKFKFTINYTQIAS